MVRRGVFLIAVVIVTAILTPSLLLAGSQTATVTVSVTGFTGATVVDGTSSIKVDPATVKTMNYDGWNMWVNTTTKDDVILNLTGVNVNFTVYYSVTFSLPPSYPAGLAQPLLGATYKIDSVNTSEALSSTAIYTVKTFTITLDKSADNLGTQYSTALSQLTWIDLPEGFLNTLYESEPSTNSGTLNETEWYPYIYAKQVTIPVVQIKYDPATDTYVKATQVTVCLLLADPDSSIANNNAFSGDEALIIHSSCDYDVDTSNATTTASTVSYVDLNTAADYAFVGGYSTSVPTSAVKFYDYNQTAFAVINATITLADGSTARLYAIVNGSVDATAGTINLVFTPVYPVPYNAVLAGIYASNQYPYLHIWPLILVPVGAPAGTYTATVDVTIQQV
ncbi:hypothetical protein Pyrfu_0660 [Pyrolobus fumarii 1A]|uniref:Uncharacterized protein n=1 Tax=Pyrolobus fumarii (strain DSM 11204 / 1A) TaxID=694429 RepID=G0EHF4_PYRF1|nr:hypothetical protein Pyrfu_0660 [Pyrolobus fumarii 1A]